MARFLIQRLAETALVLFLMSFLIYGLIGLMPGDPIDIMISSDPNMTPEDAERLREIYGLNLPIYERYWNWLTAALGGDLGYSRLYAQPVLDVQRSTPPAGLIFRKPDQLWVQWSSS